MFSTLVESRAVRRRSARGAVISIALHSVMIAAAVALTYPTARGATPGAPTQHAVVFVPAPVPHDVQRATTAVPSTPLAPRVPVLNLPVPLTTPAGLPPIDIARPGVPEEVVIGGGGLPPGHPGLGGADPSVPGGVLAAEVVDRVPRIVGNPQPPRYPDALRQSGATGQVIVRFVVDTLGKAELADLAVVEATHPLFASAVKNALLGYRFTPGEAAGRKVRTMVQIPFSFTLR